MTTTLGILRELVSTGQPVQSGVVIEVTPTTIILKTPGGRREFNSPSPEQYRVGSDVRYQGELLVGLSPDRAGLPRYSV